MAKMSVNFTLKFLRANVCVELNFRLSGSHMSDLGLG